MQNKIENFINMHQKDIDCHINYLSDKYVDNFRNCNTQKEKQLLDKKNIIEKQIINIEANRIFIINLAKANEINGTINKNFKNLLLQLKFEELEKLSENFWDDNDILNINKFKLKLNQHFDLLSNNKLKELDLAIKTIEEYKAEYNELNEILQNKINSELSHKN